MTISGRNRVNSRRWLVDVLFSISATTTITITHVDDSFFAIVPPPIIRHAQFIAPVSFHFADIAIKPIVPQCAIISGDIYGGEIAATLIRKTNFNYFSSPEESWRERS